MTVATTAAEIAKEYCPERERDLELMILRHMEHHILAAAKAERERICKIVAGILPTAAYEEFEKRVASGASSFW